MVWDHGPNLGGVPLTPNFEEPHGASVLPPVDHLRLGNPNQKNPEREAKWKLLGESNLKDI